MSEISFRIRLTQQRDYQFLVDFSDTDIPDLLTDETPPLGGNAGPNPSRMLGAAVANCLAASLLFALRKFHNAPEPVSVDATVHLGRNEEKRLRVEAVDVALQLGKAAASLERLDRVLAQFEDFCVVTQSVRSGFAVNVSVADADGIKLK